MRAYVIENQDLESSGRIQVDMQDKWFVPQDPFFRVPEVGDLVEIDEVTGTYVK